MLKKPASIAEMISVVSEYNKLQDLCLRNQKSLAGKPNPLLDELYVCAHAAAKSLQPAMMVTIKTSPAK